MAELDAKAQSLKATFAARLFNDRLAKLPEPIREDTRKALATEAAKRTEVQKYLAGKFAAILSPPEAKLPAILASTYPDYKTQSAAIASAIAAAASPKDDVPRNPRLLRPAGRSRRLRSSSAATTPSPAAKSARECCRRSPHRGRSPGRPPRKTPGPAAAGSPSRNGSPSPAIR